MADETRSVTTHDLLAMKERGERIVVLTCYDALVARLLDAAGVDLLLVGDSVNQARRGARDGGVRHAFPYVSGLRPRGDPELRACHAGDRLPWSEARRWSRDGGDGAGARD